MDLVLLLVLLIIVPIGALLMQPPSFATAAVSVIVFAIFFKVSIEKIQDFRSSVKELKGVESWESDFMSIGTLVFNYKGEKMSYKSELKGKSKDYISVNYTLSANNNSKKEFAIINQEKGWLGEFAVFGDSKFLEAIKKEISSFNKNYCIISMANASGVLETVVELSFKKGAPPSKEAKLDEMQAFLRSFLDFEMKINQALRKAPKSPSKKPLPRLSRRKENAKNDIKCNFKSPSL
jgi:hypothetical protein